MVRVAVTGASGFVGQHLLASLAKIPSIEGIALGRQRREGGPSHWRSCDLYSLLQAEEALQGVDVAIYLVHSMLPTAHLSQGRFEDFDLILADNFARACRKNGVRQIIYVGGLIPNQDRVSTHLRSRREVERALAAHGTPVTVLRCGLILGNQGSSFQILVNLVRRLPVLVCPLWTAERCQPVGIASVVTAVETCLLRSDTFNQTYDLGGPATLSYLELMKETARVLGLKRTFLSVPWLSPRLSALWVSVVSGAPRHLVAPLIESLTHSMLADASRRLPGWTEASSVEDLLRAETGVSVPVHRPRAFERLRLPTHDVRSVQRLPLPPGRTAEWVAQEYMRWLPNFFSPVLRVRIRGPECQFRVRGFPYPLLILEINTDRSRSDRALFYITGGLLARKHTKGRLEFREALDGESVLAAIHDFRPALPWLVYINTQAIVHLWVMKAFARHLKRLKDFDR